jgi:hypothetical protein
VLKAELDLMDSCPTSYGACYRNGVLDNSLLYRFLQRRHEKAKSRRAGRRKRDSTRAAEVAYLIESGMLDRPEVVRRVRSVKRKPMIVTLWNDEDMLYTPKMSLWYMLYIRNPKVDDTRFQALFRVRFRLPFASFQGLLEKMMPLPQFQRWQRKDATQQESAPLALLLLGVLRILGRSWTFCDIHESTGIGKENIRQFFHVFIKWGGGALYDQYVKYPTTTAEAATQLSDYARAGFHGAVGSTDATHVSCDRIPVAVINQHRGYKLATPARTYNFPSASTSGFCFLMTSL